MSKTPKLPSCVWTVEDVRKLLAIVESGEEVLYYMPVQFYLGHKL